MLNPDGSISFVAELLDVVEAFLDAYEGECGRLDSALERALVASYVLGVMRCDLDLVWECLGEAPVFGALHPRQVFDECGRSDHPDREERRAAVIQVLHQRGWMREAAR